MNGIVRFLLSGVAVLLTAYLLPGVHVEHYGYALLVAALLSIANVLVKPILVVLTIPITILTLGLVVWSMVIGARLSSSALLFVLFAAPLCVAYALGFGTRQETVGEMLHTARPKDLR